MLRSLGLQDRSNSAKTFLWSKRRHFHFALTLQTMCSTSVLPIFFVPGGSGGRLSRTTYLHWPKDRLSEKPGHHMGWQHTDRPQHYAKENTDRQPQTGSPEYTTTHFSHDWEFELWTSALILFQTLITAQLLINTSNVPFKWVIVSELLLL